MERLPSIVDLCWWTKASTLSFLEQQKQRNRATQDNWEASHEHREKIASLIRPLAEQNASLCVLGFGNGNDFDLSQACEKFRSVLLVDIDQEAMQAGIRAQLDISQNAADPNSADIQTRELDLCGFTHLFADDMAEDGAASEKAAAIIAKANSYEPSLPKNSFDVVISTCLLSQLFDGLAAAVPLSPNELLPVLQAARRQHLRTIVDACRPGCTAWLITDFVSSTTAPELLDKTASLARLVPRLMQTGNFFTGLNPAVILHELTTLPEFSASVLQARCDHVWRWQLGPRVFAVAGIEIKKHPPAN